MTLPGTDSNDSEHCFRLGIDAPRLCYRARFPAVIRYRRERWTGSQEGWVEEPSVLQDLKNENRPPTYYLAGIAVIGEVWLVGINWSRGLIPLAVSFAELPILLCLIWGTKRLIEAGIPIAIRADHLGVAIAYPYSVRSADWADFEPRVKGPFLTNPTRVVFPLRKPPGGGFQLYGALIEAMLLNSQGIVRWEFPQDYPLGALMEY